MADILTFVLLAASLAVLVKSSEVVIDRSVELSRLLGVSKVFIGFIFIAFATSLPELAVSLVASFRGEGQLVAGTLFGANIADMTLILAAAAFASTFAISKKDYKIISEAVVLTGMIALFSYVLGGANFVFGLFAVIIFFLFSKFIISDNLRFNGRKEPVSITFSEVRNVLIILAAIAVVIISANIVTGSAVEIAKSFGVAEAIIGATIIAAGTTLPELMVSVTAARKKQVELAIGNVVGSLVANGAFIFGIAAIISPIAYTPETGMIVLFSVLTSIIFLYLARKRVFGLMQSILLFSVYALFLIASIFYVGFAYA